MNDEVEKRESGKAALRRIRQAHHPVPSNVEGHELRTDWEIGGGRFRFRVSWVEERACPAWRGRTEDWGFGM